MPDLRKYAVSLMMFTPCLLSLVNPDPISVISGDPLSLTVKWLLGVVWGIAAILAMNWFKSMNSLITQAVEHGTRLTRLEDYQKAAEEDAKALRLDVHALRDVRERDSKHVADIKDSLMALHALVPAFNRRGKERG